jgi:hypothetical protein
MLCEKETGIEIVPRRNQPRRVERKRLLFSIFHAKCQFPESAGRVS